MHLTTVRCIKQATERIEQISTFSGEVLARSRPGAGQARSSAGCEMRSTKGMLARAARPIGSCVSLLALGLVVSSGGTFWTGCSNGPADGGGGAATGGQTDPGGAGPTGGSAAGDRKS